MSLRSRKNERSLSILPYRPAKMSHSPFAPLRTRSGRSRISEISWGMVSGFQSSVLSVRCPVCGVRGSINGCRTVWSKLLNNPRERMCVQEQLRSAFGLQTGYALGACSNHESHESHESSEKNGRIQPGGSYLAQHQILETRKPLFSFLLFFSSFLFVSFVSFVVPPLPQLRPRSDFFQREAEFVGVAFEHGFKGLARRFAKLGIDFRIPLVQPPIRICTVHRMRIRSRLQPRITRITRIITIQIEPSAQRTIRSYSSFG